MSLCHMRHSYLLKDPSCLKNFNPRILSRMMDKELLHHTTYRTLEPPFLTLASSIPLSCGPTFDSTRAKIAFGRRALPKLKKEIHSDDILTVILALNSIHDLVHDPEKAFEAFNIGLIDRLTDMMLHEKDCIREKICMILRTLAGLETGRRAIVRRYKILHNLAMLMEDKVGVVKYKANMLTEQIAFSPVTACALNCADYLILTLRLIGGNPKIENDETLIFNLATLKMLLEREVKILAMEHNAMNILTEVLQHDNDKVKMLALDCIALLCHMPEGRADAAKKNLGLILCKMLFEPSTLVRIKVAGALAFVTIQSSSRKELCKKCTIEILMEILENFQNSEGQLMAMKVLSNLYEDPKGRQLIWPLRGKIKNIIVINDKEVQRHKNMLISLINRKKAI